MQVFDVFQLLNIHSKTECRGFKSFCPCQNSKHRFCGVCCFLYVQKMKTRHSESVEGCGSPAETSAYKVCRSTDRAGRRDQVLLPLPVENGSTVRFWAVFLLLFKISTRSVLPHFDARNRCGFTIRRHTLTTIPSVTSSIKHQNFSSDWISAGAFLCLLRYKFWLKFQSPRLYR